VYQLCICQCVCVYYFVVYILRVHTYNVGEIIDFAVIVSLLLWKLVSRHNSRWSKLP